MNKHMGVKMKGLLLDADYETRDGRAVIRLFLKTGDKCIVATDRSFFPYFYVIPDRGYDGLQGKLKGIEVNGARVKAVEIVSRKRLGNELKVLKCKLNHPQDVPKIREVVKGLDGGEIAEHDIPFVRRYLIDKGLVPMDFVEVEGEEKDNEVEIRKIAPAGGEYPPMKVMAFDIEVYNPKGSPREKEDPIIMISLASNTGIRKVLSYKGTEDVYDGLEVLTGEKEILKRFEEIVKEEDIDVLIGYNTDQFDLPYINERLKQLKINLKLGRDGSGIKIESARGVTKSVVKGRVHVDLYPIIRRSIRLSSYVLENVVREVLGVEKEKLSSVDMCRCWEEGGKDLQKFIKYSMEDAAFTLELGEKFLPQYYELARIVKMPLYDVARMSTGQMVEWLLIREAFVREEIVPNRPKGTEFVRRTRDTYAGGYVKEPKKGTSENIAVFDFRSLYPSVIITHNVDPSTFMTTGCRDNRPPDFDYCFSMEKKGFIPAIVEDIVNRRMEVKKRMKESHDKIELKILDVKQGALKILANSFYGYMGYPRARWYKKECAEGVASFARMYIKDVMKIAEEDFGLEVVYGDTDSLFVLIPEEKKDKAIEFLERVNKSLPGIIELEYEGFYKRGIFITKKRYALIDENDKIIVKGLEFVRRDWAPIARITQQRVLEAVLKDASPKEAAKIVKDTIDAVKNRRISIDDIAIYTQLSRRIESYVNKGAHVIAAEKMKQRGREVAPGTMVGYIITKGTKMITQRAEPVEDVTIEDYDPEYYIENQILPSVLRIMESLGYSKSYLKEGFKQENLERWFG